MTTKLVNVRYEDGKRIATQEVAHSKSDDLFTLANLQRRLESILSLIAEPPAGYDAARLEAEKADIVKEMELIEGYIAGYDTQEETA